MRQNENRRRMLKRLDRAIKYVEQIYSHTKLPDEITTGAVLIFHDLSNLYDKIEQWNEEVPYLPRGIAKSVLFPDGKEYSSINEAAKAHKISWTTAATCLKENRLPMPRGNPSGIPITIDGVSYPSLRAAEIALNLPKGKLYR